MGKAIRSLDICRTRVHCAACRESAYWRGSVEAIFGELDWTCPDGLPLGLAADLGLLEKRTRRRIELCDACPHQVLLEATCEYPEGAPSCNRITNGAGRPCRPEFELRLRSGDGPAGCPWKELRPPFE